jgi:hypothetical protein
MAALVRIIMPPPSPSVFKIDMPPGMLINNCIAFAEVLHKQRPEWLIRASYCINSPLDAMDAKKQDWCQNARHCATIEMRRSHVSRKCGQQLRSFESMPH